MEKFEYRTHVLGTEGFFGGDIDDIGFQAELNRLGAEGWELVSSLPIDRSGGVTWNILSIFKRKI